METRTYNVYKIDELPKEAKEKAIENWRATDDYVWHEENVKSLEAFCDYFNINIPNYEYSYSGHIDSSDIIIDLKEFAPLKDSDDLTGYCADFPLIEAINKNGSVSNAFQAWLEFCIKDYTYSDSDKNIIEIMQDNDYDFTLEGEID